MQEQEEEQEQEEHGDQNKNTENRRSEECQNLRSTGEGEDREDGTGRK